MSSVAHRRLSCASNQNSSSTHSRASERAVSPDELPWIQILNPMEADDPLGLSLGILLAIVSAFRSVPVPPGFAVAGDMSVQGAILPPDSIGEMVLLARESGATMLRPTART